MYEAPECVWRSDKLAYGRKCGWLIAGHCSPEDARYQIDGVCVRGGLGITLVRLARRTPILTASCRLIIPFDSRIMELDSQDAIVKVPILLRKTRIMGNIDGFRNACCA